ncbi:MFS transporter, AAHS family, 4-hydroxybenzoate transporter [Rhizobiales bacterium GAS188]|nr:MFS transporter, AAHS family, 4-hydroxybenzoate transporter [Rhizobiales bacterium GAS188]
MAVHGRRVPDAKPSLEAAALPPAASGTNPSFPDIAGLINAHPLSSFQIGIMVLIGGVVVMDGFDVQAIGFVAPALTQDWHLDPTVLGPIFGAGLLGMLFGSMLLSMLADRVGRRPVLVGSTAFFSLCMLVTAAAGSVQQLVFLRFLTGLGIGGVMANAVALASEYSPQRQRASLLMWISCGFTGGAIAGGLISASLIPWGGWRSVFLIGGVLPLGMAIVMYARLPESLLFLSLRQEDREELGRLLRRIAPGVDPDRNWHLARPEQARGRGSFTELFRDGRALMTLLLWLISFANLLNLFFLANWLPLLSTRMGFSSSTAVLMGTTLQLGGFIGAIFMGPLIDRLGYYRVLVPVFLIAGLAVAAIGSPSLSMPLLYLVIFAAGICVVGTQPALNALSSTLYPTEIRATGVGWSLGVGRAGAIVGPVVAAHLVALDWSSQALFLAASIPASLSSVVAIGLAVVTRRKLPSL